MDLQTAPKRVGGPLWAWILVAIALPVVLGQLLHRDEDPAAAAASEAQWKAKRAIDVCWEQQARKSLSPESQRVVASVCEGFEEDYRNQYGRYYKQYGKKP